jgi:hypothetical protein
MTSFHSRSLICSLFVLLPVHMAAAQNSETSMRAQTVSHKTVKVENIAVFYREAGPQGWSDHTAAAWLSFLVTYVRAVVFEVV